MAEYRLEKWPADLLVQPPVSHIGILDFHRGEPIIDISCHQAKAYIAQIPDPL